MTELRWQKKLIEFTDVTSERLTIVVNDELHESGARLSKDAWDELAWEFQKSIEKIVFRAEEKNIVRGDAGCTPMTSCVVCHRNKRTGA